VKYYAQVNDRCRKLAAAGLIERREIEPNRFRNFYTGPAGQPKPAGRPIKPGTVPSPPAIPDRAWYWEGNIQAKLVQFLVLDGYEILRVADTASRETGKDVIARKGGRELWASVKGRPTGTERTNAATQARTWFQNAFFELAVWRGEDPKAAVLLAMPDYVTYRTLATRISWLKPTLQFNIAWVSENGSVSIE
jgi:hypothetical protein